MTEHPREFDLQAGPIRIAARAWGSPDGVPVLALHGWLDNAATFERLAPLLEGLYVVALDLPGHGRSDHRGLGPWYHFIDYVADVIAAADALDWERFSLLGHSLGGGVACSVAGACPERIERLALIEALGPLTDEPSLAPERLGHAIARAHQAARRPPRSYRSLEEIIEARRHAGDLSHDAARLLVERATVAAEDGIRWRSDPRLRLPSPYRLSEEHALAFLGAIRAPALLIAADDGLLPMDDPTMQRRLKTVARLEVRHLPGHHHLHLEDPAPVAGILAPFLAATEVGPNAH